MSDMKCDVAALLMSCLDEDWDGCALFLNRTFETDMDRFCDLITGLAGFSLGVARSSHELAGLSREQSDQVLRELLRKMAAAA